MKNKHTLGETIKGHFCWGCLPQVDHNVRSQTNLEKVDACLYCDYVAAGIDSTALVGNWLKLGKSY